MNIHQSVPRSDCFTFAKCGKHSLAYCRRYGAAECGPCNMVKRKPKLQVIENGVEKKICAHCGKVLPPYRFYNLTKQYKDKTYHYKSSWCKVCTSKHISEKRRIQKGDFKR